GERRHDALDDALVRRRVDGLHDPPALVVLLELDLAVRIRERDAGHGVLLHAEELLLLRLALRLRDLVDPEIGAEPGRQDQEDEDPAEGHRDRRRHQTAIPVAISSWGTIRTER